MTGGVFCPQGTRTEDPLGERCSPGRASSFTHKDSPLGDTRQAHGDGRAPPFPTPTIASSSPSFARSQGKRQLLTPMRHCCGHACSLPAHTPHFLVPPPAHLSPGETGWAARHPLPFLLHPPSSPQRVCGPANLWKAAKTNLNLYPKRPLSLIHSSACSCYGHSGLPCPALSSINTSMG